MDKVAEYFDACADEWEERFVRPDAAQDIAARIAGVKSGMRVADIGCGTGIMTPIYLGLGVAETVGIDVSPRMIAHAADKFESESRATFVCSDATTFEDQERFDAVVAYNCYPHFLDREALARNVAALLRPGGRFVVAHSMGRAHMNEHHAHVPSSVTSDLQPASIEAAVWEPFFEIDSIVDAPDFYCFAGTVR